MEMLVLALEGGERLRDGEVIEEVCPGRKNPPVFLPLQKLRPREYSNKKHPATKTTNSNCTLHITQLEMEKKIENGVKVNGNGDNTPTSSTSRPRTPSLNTLSLTEYSSNPTPPSQSPNVKGIIPDEFVLPNGYPDVLSHISPILTSN